MTYLILFIIVANICILLGLLVDITWFSPANKSKIIKVWNLICMVAYIVLAFRLYAAY